MQPAERLDALLGAWHTVRVIRHADGSTARFAGKTTWSGTDHRLRSVETGILTQGGASLDARRETLWIATPGGIDVRFADGRPFHKIEGARAHHGCPPDDYRLIYDFGAWPRWSVRWRVTGPRKDYRALTRYARLPPSP